MQSSIKRKSTTSLSEQSQKNQKRQAEKDEVIRSVSYPFCTVEESTITTPVVSTEVKDLLFGRFKEELLPKIDGTWNRRRNSADKATENPKNDAETALRSRLVIGELNVDEL